MQYLKRGNKVIKYFQEGKKINDDGETEIELPEISIHPNSEITRFFRQHYPDKTLRNSLYRAEDTIKNGFEKTGIFITTNSLLQRLMNLHKNSNINKAYDWNNRHLILPDEVNSSLLDDRMYDDGRGRAFTWSHYDNKDDLKRDVFVDPTLEHDSSGLTVLNDLYSEFSHGFNSSNMPQRMHLSEPEDISDEEYNATYELPEGAYHNENVVHSDRYGIEKHFHRYGKLFDVNDLVLNDYKTHKIPQISIEGIKKLILDDEVNKLWPILAQNSEAFYEAMRQLEKSGDEVTLSRLKSFVKHAREINMLREGQPQYFKNGRKIHIKESQKGSFTRYCGGNVTSECIARGKASPDPRIRKKATFAANARKWKHSDGGIINYFKGGNKFNSEDTYSNNTEEQDDVFNPYTAEIDSNIFNPYSNVKLGLPDTYNSKWYVGDKGDQDITQSNRYKTVKTIYDQLQQAIRKYYPEYSNDQVNNLADFMSRHYVKENGWIIVNKSVGGYGKVRSCDEWVKGMKSTYPNAMKATTYKQYVEGLKSNYQGNKYNSVNPNYFNELYNQFGNNTRVDKVLKHIRGIK